VMPATILSAVTAFVFLLPLSSEDKASTFATILLAYFVLLQTLTLEMPTTNQSSGTPKLQRVIDFGTIACAVAFVLAMLMVTIKKFLFKENEALVCLVRKRKPTGVGDSSDNRTPTTGNENTEKANAVVGTPSEGEQQYAWDILGLIVNIIILLFIYIVLVSEPWTAFQSCVTNYRPNDSYWEQWSSSLQSDDTETSTGSADYYDSGPGNNNRPGVSGSAKVVVPGIFEVLQIPRMATAALCIAHIKQMML
jgi:hypothetical protein